ncbi:FRIGIDA-like protein 3 [Cardamine amara subsp. amara]|uniref:FRIGIDA-like protein 3 n=1 Tax=Cardamine amara subsp. amara TaxID=228776 RepID=A0ABD1BUK7_CARAN
MEEITLEDEVKLCDVKREHLGKVMEQIKSRANDALIFTLQWSDLEDHLKVVGDKMEKRFKQLVSKELEFEKKSFALEGRAKVVEASKAELSDFEKKAEGFRSEIEVKREELGFLKKSLEECRVDLDLKAEELRQMEIGLESYRVEVNAEKERLGRTEHSRRELEEEMERKRKDLSLVMAKIAECEKLFETRSSELMKTHGEVELKGKQLEEMNIDLESHRGEVKAEKDHLGRIENGRKELEEEMERKRKDLSLVQDKIAECEKLFETRSSDLMKTQGEVELKGKQLEQMNIDLERHRGEVNEKMEHLDISRTLSRELEEEIERKKKDRTAVLDEIAEFRKQLESVEKQLDSQQKLLETRSSELVSKKKEYEGLIMDLDLVSSLDKNMKETCQQVESKTKELKEIERLINERSAHSESIKLLLQEHTEELALREKKYIDITEAIRKLSSELVDKEKTLQRAKDFIQKLGKKQRLKQKNVESTEANLERITAGCDSKKMELLSVKDKLGECLKNLEIKEREFKSLQLLITERNGQVKEGEKKKQHLDNSIEELIRQLQEKQEEISSFNKAIRESSDELGSKRKHLDQVRSSITDLTTDLYSVKKNIQEKEKEHVKLKASLMELVLEKKQFDARSEKIELKEKELDGKEKKLESVEQKLAQCVKDYELKAKKLASFCQQSNPDQHVDLTPDAKVCDEKTLQLLLHGHLKKCHQLYLDVSNALKASSEPEKLVLHIIQWLHQRMVVTNLDPNSVRRSIICLLECLIDMSPKPNTEVQEEAIKSASEWKNTALVKAKIPVEVLGCLHFLTAFSLAYTFDADKVKNLFDVAFLRKYVPSMCEVLGVSSLALVNNVQALDDPEHQLVEAPISNGRDSRCMDALMDVEGSSAFSANEVFTGLQAMTDPAEYVLNAVNDELMGAQQRGELSLSEPIVKNLVMLLEELQRVVKPSDHLLPNASQVANRWSSMMGTRSQISPLEAWGFLQLIVAYGLVLQTDPDKTSKFALYVAHFNQAPKLFESLGLSKTIPYFVHQLLTEHHFIPAIRFMIFFKLNCNFSPLAYLKAEIMSLRSSAKLKRRFDPQAEDKDAAKLRDIIELIEDFKLDIDLPVDLIVKFMVPRDSQTQNQCVVSSAVPVQPPQVHKLASNTVIQGTCITTHGSNPNLPVTSLGASSINSVQQFFDKYRTGGSTVLQSESSHQFGLKRQRVERRDPRPSIRPCFNPSRHGRF